MTRSEEQIPVELLRELFDLGSDGLLRWRNRPATHFAPSPRRTAEHKAANWNSRNAGRIALTAVTPFGHLTGRINRLSVYAHRVVWAMTTGSWPIHEIDHINGLPGDNRPENLRDVPHIENLRNQATRKNNSSGATGVRFYKPRSKWAASIDVNGRSKHIGYFDSMDQAIAARKAAQNEHHFHPNHGRKAA